MSVQPKSRNGKGRGTALALALLLGAGVPAHAQQNVVSTTTTQSSAAPVVQPGPDNTLQLSLDQAIQIALQQNLGLVAERYTRLQRRLGITQNLGIYDLTAVATLSASDTQNAPGVSQLEGSSANSQAFNFSFRQRVPTGGDVTFGVTNDRRESDSPLAADINYGTGFSFSYDQPLLRNFGRLANELNLVIAQTNSRVGREEFERQVIATTQQVIEAYWNLVGSREQLGVARQSLELARELHERNRIQVEVGTMAPLELVQSEAAIATRDEEIIRTTSAVGDAEDELRRLLNLPPGPLWQAPITPTTDPNVEERPTINLEQAILTAYAERPELQTLQLQLEQSQIEAEFARNQLKPDLGLSVQYGYTGDDPGGFGDAFSRLTGFGFRGWDISLQFAYPIQNRAARAQSAIANLDVERFRTQVEEQRSIISTEVRRAARAVETAAQQIEAARISRQFQERNLEAERKRYENGMSTSFQITQIQDDLTQAASREVSARINYRTALTEFYRATGRLLAQQSVTIDDPEEPDFRARRYSFDRDLLPGVPGVQTPENPR